MKFFVKYLVFLIGMLWVMKPEVFAFSIDGFQVRSQYGEKLNANFEIHLDFDGPVKVGLGDEDDYAKMGLERDNIIDVFTLDLIRSGDKLKSTVKVSSNIPIFFPSLNPVSYTHLTLPTILRV